MKIKGILAAALMTMIGVAMAEEMRNARIDVEGTVDNVKTAMDFTSSDGGVGKQADWLKEDKGTRLTIEFPASKEWKKYSFTFMPKTDGKVMLDVMGNYAPDPKDRQWFWYDNFTVEGAIIKNGDFEIKDDSGKLEGWNVNYDAEVGGSAQNGKIAIKANHDNRVTQNIPVKAGVPVTVIFWMKSDK